MCTQIECEGVVCLTVDKAVITSLYHLQPPITFRKSPFSYINSLQSSLFIIPPSSFCSCCLCHSGSSSSFTHQCFIFSSFSSVLSVCTCTSWCPVVFSLCMQISTATLEHSRMCCTLTHYSCLPFVNTLKSQLSATHFIAENKQHCFYENASCSFVYVPLACMISSGSNFRNPFKKEGCRGLQSLLHSHS